jgi:hypothetical protein
VDGKWIEFNDRSVSSFDISKMAEEAFGSDNPANQNSRSAYMLVYERVKPIELKPKTKIQANGIKEHH